MVGKDPRNLQCQMLQFISRQVVNQFPFLKNLKSWIRRHSAFVKKE
uniref:Alternative protein CHD1 n=1 Tax=Homo sapiens TaxID=9606 RepID=L8E9V9_HUMAN|nr:alternative protein CHD1 [Homo sapiens]